MVIKIALDRADAIQAVTIDAMVGPFARALGVQTPALVAFDDSRDIVPVPFAVYHRVRCGMPLERFVRRPVLARDAWTDVGRELARVHAVSPGSDVPARLREFRQSPEVDPRPWVGELRAHGALTGPDAEFLHTLLDRLATAALADVPLRLCHGDLNATNILVAGESRRFLALIDWAGAGGLDPVWDFAAVPLNMVPFLLDGHRSVAPLPLDRTAEARIAWCQMQMRLLAARRMIGDESIGTKLRRDVDHIRTFVAAELA